ncbi:substrate-binding domain-containing protein [Sorangium sp. So ce1128]
MAQIPGKTEHDAPSGPSPAREALKSAVALGVLGALVGYLARGGNLARGMSDPPRFVDVEAFSADCGPRDVNGRPLIVNMVYSEDKRSWLEYAAERFARRCPNIQVKLTAMGDIESADAIIDAYLEPKSKQQKDELPTLWAPADDIVVQYLAARWKQRSSEVPDAGELLDGSEARSLARSPLVVLVWHDRYQVLEAILRSGRSEEGPWWQIPCALIPRDADLSKIALEDRVPGRWIDWYGPLTPSPAKKPAAAPKKRAQIKPAYEAPFPTLQEIERWGRVKFGHTSPTRAASGLETLYLMAYAYVLPPKERAALEGSDAPAQGSAGGGVTGSEHLRGAFARAFAERKDSLRQALGRCEGGLDEAPESARLLTESMINVGPGRYDGVMTYEHLALPALKRLGAHESSLRDARIIYPQPTIVNEHPALFIRPDPAQKQAASRWLDFLLGKEMQEKAIQYGFRPANPNVSIRASDVDENPFLDLRRYGVELDPDLREPPHLDGDAIHELIGIWQDATGRY